MDKKNLSIKKWAIDDRPREKMLSKGVSVLSNAELLAILIGSGTREDSAVDVAKRILNSVNNNLNELGKLSVDDLKKIKGIGDARAVTLVSSLELGRRRKLTNTNEKIQIRSSKDVFNYFHPIIADLHYEEFWILYLNRSNKVIESKKLSQGGVTGTVIDLKIVLKNALQKLSSSVILCHNHPSGNKNPSDADIKITSKLKNAAEILDIKILDHLIITDKEYFSFADEGII